MTKRSLYDGQSSGVEHVSSKRHVAIIVPFTTPKLCHQQLLQVSIAPKVSAHALLDVANKDHADTTLAQQDRSGLAQEDMPSACYPFSSFMWSHNR